MIARFFIGFFGTAVGAAMMVLLLGAIHRLGNWLEPRIGSLPTAGVILGLVAGFIVGVLNAVAP